MSAPRQPMYLYNLVQVDGYHNFEMWNTALRQYLRMEALLHHLVLDEMFPEERNCETCREAWCLGRAKVWWLIHLTLGNRLVREVLYERGWHNEHPSPKVGPLFRVGPELRDAAPAPFRHFGDAFDDMLGDGPGEAEAVTTYSTTRDIQDFADILEDYQDMDTATLYKLAEAVAETLNIWQTEFHELRKVIDDVIGRRSRQVRKYAVWSED
ncbi:hypothetical protein N0V85_009311 [Neurospora sp. IMI 360204]|nr:hypothetical protein N0V85_009311 [Neurospora sp. IMI 360204]